ncbi:MAG TPA: protoporphyrinogen oxidase HemJ [Kiloniellales bacterium]|nr:protoporphyrinogen oxidase HemJ [Kiloniellales bacterium]
MAGFLGEGYLWVKALHIISVIAWMAGMLYLPRLYVYHCAAEPGSAQSETFKVMERRLLRAIINPAMIASWVFGLLLVADLDLWTEPWMHAKFALLLGMQLAHAAFARWRREFAADRPRRSTRLYRIANEVPTALMIGIVILVVVRPF